jgi:hypothetical protein
VESISPIIVWPRIWKFSEAWDSTGLSPGSGG